MRRFPSATALAASVLGPKLASRVRREQLARIEPVVRARHAQQRRDRSVEFRVARATVLPERPAVRDLGERQHLLDAAVAVGRDDEHRTRERARLVSQAEHDVVVEFALLKVRDEIERTVVRPHFVEQSAEGHRRGEGIQRGHPRSLPAARRERKASSRGALDQPRLPTRSFEDATCVRRHAGEANGEQGGDLVLRYDGAAWAAVAASRRRVEVVTGL